MTMHDPRGEPRRWHRPIGVAAGCVALSAWGGALGLAAGALSLGDLEERLPFGSPVLGGVALALVVAAPHTALARRAWRRDPDATVAMQVTGGLLVGWIVVQLAFLREVSWLHVVYGSIGLATLVGGRLLRRLEGLHGEAGVDVAAAERFLALRRIAVVGASHDPARFGHTVYVGLRDHGRDVVPVNPVAEEVAGDPCYSSLSAVPGAVDGVVVMVTGAAAVAAVHEAAALGISHVWLFRGVGSPGALSDEALAAGAEHGLDVVAGACPFMFLEPVDGPHTLHRAIRRLDGSLGDLR